MPYSGQITLASRNALVPAVVSSVSQSHAHLLKLVDRLLSSIAARMSNAEPALLLAIPTTTPLIIKSFTFKEPAPTSCLRFKIIYSCGNLYYRIIQNNKSVKKNPSFSLQACGHGLPYFRIEGKNEHRGSTHVSWTRLVRVFVYDEVLELVKDHPYEAKVSITRLFHKFSSLFLNDLI